MSTPPATAVGRPKKRRAGVACKSCHDRKVRCNVVWIGQPCTNCQQDDAACVLHVSARGKHKRPKASSSSSVVSPGRRRHRARSGVASTATASPASEKPPPPPSPDDDDDELEARSNVDAYRAIVDPPETDEVRVPMYVGTWSPRGSPEWKESVGLTRPLARRRTAIPPAHFPRRPRPEPCLQDAFPAPAAPAAAVVARRTRLSRGQGGL